MLKLYADDIPIDGIHYDDMIVQSSLPPNAIIYQSSASNADRPPWDSFQLHRTNCPNCGAPLNRNGECEYCNTVVRDPGSTSASLSITSSEIRMDVSGISFGNVYQKYAICSECCKRYVKRNDNQNYCSLSCEHRARRSSATRDAYGILHRIDYDT